MGAHEVRRMALSLQLDTTSADAFCPRNLEKMIEAFDQGGKGALSLADFRSLLRQLGFA